MTQSQLSQPLIKVAAMGPENVLTPPETSQQSEATVPEVHRANQQQPYPRRRVRGLLGESYNQQGQHHTQKQAARVSHEGACFWEVVKEETQTTAGNDNGRRGEIRGPLPPSKNKEEATVSGSGDRRQAVDPIHEVENVREAG